MVGGAYDRALSLSGDLRPVCREVFGGMESLAEEARKAYLLSQNVLYKKEISMMVYDTALTDFILSGEVDFSIIRVVLNPLQRKVQNGVFAGFISQ